jgi:hypothetical protein
VVLPPSHAQWHDAGPGRRAALDMSAFDEPGELTWYEGLPRTVEEAYGQWREKRSALTEVTEEV